MTEQIAAYRLDAVQTRDVGPMMPVGSIVELKAAWHAYQQVITELLDDSDYAVIEGQKRRKRSGWTKIRRFYNINTDIISEQRWQDGEVYGYRITVKAYVQDAAGIVRRVEVADGACDSSEFKKGRLAASDHNVRSKAITRAKNRATSDIVGAGEVSAEEIVEGEIVDARNTGAKAAPAKPAAAAPSPTAKSLYNETAQAAITAGRLTKERAANIVSVCKGEYGHALDMLNEELVQPAPETAQAAGGAA